MNDLALSRHLMKFAHEIVACMVANPGQQVVIEPQYAAHLSAALTLASIAAKFVEDQAAGSTPTIDPANILYLHPVTVQ